MADWVRKFLYRIFLRNGTYGISLSDRGFSDQRYLRLPGVYHVCSDGDRCDLGNCGLAK